MKLELLDLTKRETPELFKKPKLKLNRLSEDENPLDEDEDAYRAIIYEKLLKEYYHLAYVFSKSISDKLLSLREGVDHDIVLD
ncbi:hypothetical protein M501DRAFT_1017463 [Patellaria atrata CBS 101060]|uniref:Uncharacterized protein n=1 Tax=Patellaria atrata CBS 101060 TaxID=1346257 RepID=A0A9P4S9I7_9PEZI|nr:hypothetical protein M501DRAFT_1017463 [Patellaria atrata CBS 101060]